MQTTKLWFVLLFVGLVQAAVLPLGPGEWDPSPVTEASKKLANACDSCEAFLTKLDYRLIDLMEDDMHISLNTLCALLPKHMRDACLQLSDDAYNSKHLLERLISFPQRLCSKLGHCSECCSPDGAPEQFHLAFTDSNSSLAISWASSTNETQFCNVTSPTTGVTAAASVSTYTYTEAGWRGWLHSAVLPVLDSTSRELHWSCGTPAHVRSGVARLPKPQADSTTVLVTGDMGALSSSDETVARMTAEVANGHVDFVLHVGDIGYANGNQTIWDILMRKLEPMASKVPYMVVPGNHEACSEFDGYKARFHSQNIIGTKSGSNNTFWGAYTVGPIQYIGISTEHDIEPGSEQHAWLTDALQNADKQRQERPVELPWLVVVAHRPMYCSNVDRWHAKTDIYGDSHDCNVNGPRFQKVLETLFLDAGVDLFIAGHLHSYERTLPTKHGEPVTANLTECVYRNPGAPVHIIHGAGGTKEGIDSWFTEPQPAWSHTRVGTHGYGRLTANATALQWEFLGLLSNYTDTFTIVKE